jgi:Protein of unknown function (DUF3037)
LNGRMQCEFYLVRYVPDPVKGEFANIGVLLREAGKEDSSVVRFTRDWSRVRCLDGDADIALLEALESEVESRLRAGPRNGQPAAKSLTGSIADAFSNSIQMTEARACLAENLITELELLMRMYVEPLRVKETRRRTGRGAIAVAMRSQFERAGVWAMMRKGIAASLYTLPGDPMKIDCGYRPNGIVKMFHAVSLEGDVEAAKVLAYSAPRLRDGVARVEAARLELTAVVEPLRTMPQGDEDHDGVERYRFAVEAMESQEIRVLTVNDLARAAETARRDLQL